MSLNRKLLALGLAGLLAFVASTAAKADLVLGFSTPTYTITDVGQTATVAVVLSQTAAGPQVGVGNALLTAAIRVSYAPGSGVADLTAVSAPGWDDVSTGPLASPIDIALLSLSGITDLSGPLVLANLTFTGVAPGSIVLTVQQLDATSVDFITELGNVLDPTNVATATLTVQSNAIPEPSPLGLGFLMLGAAAAIRRLRARRLD